ncbi:hypothetical protein SAMN05421810_10815 [Amycolatopsis arida]|uniref:Uncharacterized protein n=1 Tax=Amycolatopsis arida TaxID=587909 RepID=A0A1I5YVT6_9PSEU|nr:hypothetical protein [Amycolatopsis arida]TDX89928.1 hypothetical protein CLV69_10815 [Amycolatopsis arida]SFQ48383.1 hypothetical protein SAMN05421810_10815 [Amycolatopsis arida]
MSVQRRIQVSIALGVLLGAVLVGIGLGVGVPWLTWLGFLVALVALLVWPVFGRQRGRREDAGGSMVVDHEQAGPRATGGRPDPSDADQHSTTGPTPNDVYVGRVAGSDPGSEETTGAERRANPDDDRDER